MEELIIAISRGLVEDKDAVSVTTDPPLEDGTVVYHLHVAPDDRAGLSVSRAGLPKPSAPLFARQPPAAT